MKLFLDVQDHVWSGRGGERQNGDFGMDLPDFIYKPIGWSEVMTPLGDTVGFIHSDEVQFHLGQPHFEEVVLQALGRDEKELDLTVDTII